VRAARRDGTTSINDRRVQASPLGTVAEPAARRPGRSFSVASLARITRSERGVALALFGAGALLVLAIEYVLRHTWNGDASIYLPYARNAAHGHPFSFNPSEFSSGSTSPLWSLLLALPVGVAPGTSALKVFYALASVAAYGVVFAAAVRSTGSWLGAAIGSLYVVTTLCVPAALGFESPLVVVLVATSVWVVVGLVRGNSLSPRALVPLAIVWALLPLARPEAASIVVIELLAVWLIRGRARTDFGRLAAAAAVAALPAVAYFGYSQIRLGVPSTSTAGRSEWLREHAGRVGPFYTSSFALRYLFTSPIVFAFVPGLAGLALLGRTRTGKLAAIAGAGAIVVYVLLLTFVAPGFLDTGRYLLPIAPFVAIGIAGLFSSLPAGRAAALVGTAALGLIAVGVPALRVLTHDARSLRNQPYTFDNNLQRGAAEVLNRTAAPGSTVLAYEVQVRWFLRPDLRVLSLDGITDGKVLPYIPKRDIRGFLLRYRPRYWVADPAADPPEPGAERSAYITTSPLGRAMARLRADPSLRTVREGDIEFRVLARRPGPLPYRFGPWTAVLELRYGAR
jgi:hypothetical protein